MTLCSMRFAAATIVALVSGPVGYFLVLRGQTFAGHALSHVGFTGATGAVLIGVSPIWGLVLLTVAAGIGMGMLGERLAHRDVAIGIVLALSLGFGLLFLHFFTAFAAQATSLLFGNVLAVDIATIWILLVLGISAVGARCDLAATCREHSTRVGRGEGREPAALFRPIPGHRRVGDGGVRADRRRSAGLHLDGRAGRGGATLTTRVGTGVMLSACLALAEAWLGISLAFYTDWPCSFWIAALSALVYFVTIISTRYAAVMCPNRYVSTGQCGLT